MIISKELKNIMKNKQDKFMSYTRMKNKNSNLLMI